MAHRSFSLTRPAGNPLAADAVRRPTPLRPLCVGAHSVLHAGGGQ